MLEVNIIKPHIPVCSYYLPPNIPNRETELENRSINRPNIPALLQTNYFFHGFILSGRMPKPGSMTFFKQNISSHVFFKQLLELHNVTTKPLPLASHGLQGTCALLDPTQFPTCLSFVYK